MRRHQPTTLRFQTALLQLLYYPRLEPLSQQAPQAMHRPAETHNALPSIAIDQMTLLFERLLRGQNSGTTPTSSRVAELATTTSVKQVPRLSQTTTAQSKSFSELKFGNNVSTNRETLKCAKTLLAETGLLPLIDGSLEKTYMFGGKPIRLHS